MYINVLVIILTFLHKSSQWYQLPIDRNYYIIVKKIDISEVPLAVSLGFLPQRMHIYIYIFVIFLLLIPLTSQILCYHLIISIILTKDNVSTSEH